MAGILAAKTRRVTPERPAPVAFVRSPAADALHRLAAARAEHWAGQGAWSDVASPCPGRHPAQPLLQTGTFRLCFTRFSVKLVLIDWTFGNSTMAFFTVAS